MPNELESAMPHAEFLLAVETVAGITLELSSLSPLIVVERKGLV